jgi:hypothetical protein
MTGTATSATAGPASGMATEIPPVQRSFNEPQQTYISGAFQLFLGLYILLTGSVPIIVQAITFGVSGTGSDQFILATSTQAGHDLLLLAPVLLLRRHPLGVLHPVLFAVVLWPLLSVMPQTIESFGGWAGVIAGEPLKTPYFYGLPLYSGGDVWMAITKYNAIQILALLSTYAGYLMFRGQRNFSPRPNKMYDTTSLRAVMIALIVLSLIVLLVFLQSRGGINSHLTSLGAGRFKQLAGDGIIMLMTDLGMVALFVWTAARPADVKTPIFLACLGAVTAGQFLSNGSRGSALVVPLTVGIIWALRRRRIPWKTALILIPFMFASIGLLGAVRSSSWTGSTAAEAASKTGWSDALERAQAEVELRRAMSAPVPVIERGFTVSGGPLLGQSYLVAVTAFIPRPLWPNKPRGVGSLYARWFIGAGFAGTTIPVGPEAEMYWNFGLAGVVVLSLLYGLSLGWIYQYYVRRYEDPFAIVFFVTFLMFFQFSTDRIVNFEQQSFLIVICYATAAALVRKSEPTSLHYRRLPPAQRHPFAPSRS